MYPSAVNPTRVRERYLPVRLALGVWASACSSQLDGPAPTFGSQNGSPIDPLLVCADQLTTTLDVRGQHFAPVPVDVPNDPALSLPSLTLTRSATLDGASASEVRVQYGGEPASPNADALQFIDSEHLRLTVDQARQIDGKTGRVPAGIYDAQLTNPSGKQASRRRALAVIDKPTLQTERVPALLCTSQTATALTFVGTGFLRVGDARPMLTLDGRDGGLEANALSECEPIALEGLDAELCASAQITLQPRTLDPGVYAIAIANPEPGACHSEDSAQLRVVPAPSLDSSPLDPTCAQDQTRAVWVRGEGFLEIDGEPPTVTIGGQRTGVQALEDCNDLAIAGWSIRRCQRLQVAWPELDLSEAEIVVEVANPAPADCSISVRSDVRGVLRSESRACAAM